MGVAVAGGGTTGVTAGAVVAVDVTVVGSGGAGVPVADGALSESPEQATRRAEASTTPTRSKPFHVRPLTMLLISDGDFTVFLWRKHAA